MGGVAGVLLALWATQLISRLFPSLPLPVPERVSVDGSPDLPVLAFSLGIVVLIGLLFALVPALQASRPALVPALREGGRTETMRGARARGVFVAAQIAMSVVLLVLAGLFVRTLQRALATDPRFTPDGIVMSPSSARRRCPLPSG